MVKYAAISSSEFYKRMMFIQVHKSYYLYIKIIPFTKKCFVIGKVILRSFNIFSNKTTIKCTLNFKVKKKAGVIDLCIVSLLFKKNPTTSRKVF